MPDAYSRPEVMVKCLENEGTSVVFGIPGEENICSTQELAASNIRYVLTRYHQQHPNGGDLRPGRPRPPVQGVTPVRRPGSDVRTVTRWADAIPTARDTGNVLQGIQAR